MLVTLVSTAVLPQTTKYVYLIRHWSNTCRAIAKVEGWDFGYPFGGVDIGQASVHENLGAQLQSFPSRNRVTLVAKGSEEQKLVILPTQGQDEFGLKAVASHRLALSLYLHWACLLVDKNTDEETSGARRLGVKECVITQGQDEFGLKAAASHRCLVAQSRMTVPLSRERNRSHFNGSSSRTC
jgi:hypothetical protein